MNIKTLKVTLSPDQYITTKTIYYDCHIAVERFGEETLHYTKSIPEDDFTTKFHWMMEEAERLILEEVNKQHRS